MERQLDTQRHKENKITKKSTLVVFLLPKLHDILAEPVVGIHNSYVN
jgi:hypothetical protein